MNRDRAFYLVTKAYLVRLFVDHALASLSSDEKLYENRIGDAGMR